MVEYVAQNLDVVFHALSDSTRRGMLGQLASADQTVSELAAPYAMSLAAASKHIKKLEAAGLVKREVIGRTHICRLNAEAMREAEAWIKRYAKFWATRLDTLEALLGAEDQAQIELTSTAKG
ncbi:ArsR/SmtB family transcription factor [Kordiimonas pumila]|uniref:ArsR/SmtB family transcription factor n=1 Tax=Kordiimonas pumila TaxID=2161677 RepID=A0ABV7D6F0_9PROT